VTEVFSLYQRFLNQGTLSEPTGIPDPQFALPSTVNWMRALGILVDHHKTNFKSALTAYSNVQRQTFTDQAANSIFEQLLLSLHQLSALQSLATASKKTDVARVAAVAWYYGIYSAASAMVAAQCSTIQDNHTQTANTWDRQIVVSKFAMLPFSMRLTSIVKTKADAEIVALRTSGQFGLLSPASNHDEALGAACAYLSGTADWWRWTVEEDLRQSREFRDLKVDNFRTKAARDLRDARFDKRTLSFMHQAIRYRGKANYREALYLSYGSSVETLLANYVADLERVLAAFLAMAGAFCSKRLGSTLWNAFVADVDKSRAFTTSPSTVW
jgi:hypothetical protein